MSDQSKLGIGKIISEPQFRDAIHVAVVPVTANEVLLTGEHVKINSEGMAIECPIDDAIGVVDPFLKQSNVKPGQRFWLFLYPGSITSLRHSWTHPAFPESNAATEPIQDPQEASQKAVSEQYIRDLADSVGLSYGRLIDGAKHWVYRKREGDGWGGVHHRRFGDERIECSGCFLGAFRESHWGNCFSRTPGLFLLLLLLDSQAGVSS